MTIQVRPRAAADLDDIANYLEQRSPGIGQRFLQAAQTTFTILDQMPGLGSPFSAAHPQLSGLRHHAIRKFRNYLVFYIPISDGIDVVRVLHAARDLSAIFGPGP